MNCTEAREKLPLYVGGDLDREALESLRSHLERCDECHRKVQEAVHARRELVLAFRERAQGPKLDLWSGIRAQLVAEGRILEDELGQPVRPGHSAEGAGVRARGRRLQWTRVLAPLAAAGLVLFVLHLSGAFAELPGKRSLQSAPQDGAGLVVQERPAAGGLIRVQPGEALEMPAVYRSREERTRQPAGNEAVSLTSFESDPWK